MADKTKINNAAKKVQNLLGIKRVSTGTLSKSGC